MLKFLDLLITYTLLVLAAVTVAGGDNPPTALPLVIDRGVYPTPAQFSTANLAMVAGPNDVYFTTGANTALFRWSGGRVTRLLQTNDPHPGYPGSTMDGVGTQMWPNANGHVAMVNTAAYPGERDPSGLFVYNGASFLTVALAGDTAPDTGGKPFRSFSTPILNNNDVVAFLGGMEPNNMGPVGIFVGPPGGPLAKVAGQGETAPDTGGGQYGGFTLFGLNDSGVVGFMADIYNGDTSRAVFLYSGGTVVKVVKNGEPIPGNASGRKFSLRGSGNYALNAAGDVGFASNSSPGDAPGIWTGNGSGVRKVMVQGDATPLGGTFCCDANSITLRGFNDAGRALYNSNISGGSSNFALLLDDLANPAEVVMYAGQPAPGGTTETLGRNIQSAFLNNLGHVALRAAMSGGSYFFGAFRYSSGSLQKVIFQGETTPIGGTYGLAGRGNPSDFDDSGRWVFPADVLGPNQAALFVHSPSGGMQTVFSTSDPLPAGSNYVLRTLNASSDNEVLLSARRAGGKMRVFARPVQPGSSAQPRLIAGDLEPFGNNGTMANIGGFEIDDKEEVVFIAQLIGAPGYYPANAILGLVPGDELDKVVETGDGAPGAAGGQFNSFPSVWLNDQSQVAFTANIMNSPSTTGVFLASEALGYQAIARAGDTSPAGSTFQSFGTTAGLNESGQVAFYANHAPGGVNPGIFVGSVGGPPAKVVAWGDPGPGGGSFNNIPNVFKLNNQGKVAFMAGLGGGSVFQGVFLGAGGSAPAPVALTGDEAPGTFGARFQNFNQNAVEVNSAGTVAFHAFLQGKVSSGFFAGSAGAPPAPRLISGQALPGGGAVTAVAAGAGWLALAESGALAMWAPNLDGAPNLSRFVIADPAGTLRAFAASGQPASGSLSSFGRLFPRLSVNSNGVFTFGCMLVDGPSKAGVFRSVP